MANFLSRFFPSGSPRKAPKVGMDISSHSVRFAELVPSGTGYVLGCFGEKKIPDGVVEGGRIKDAGALKNTLSSLRSKYRLTAANVSIPGGKTHFIRMNPPRVPGGNIRSVIESKIGDHVIAGGSGDFVFDYSVISENESEYDVEVALFPREMKEEYSSLFEGTGITLAAFEAEEKAIARAILPPGDRGTRMIIDFGKTQTGVFVVCAGVPMLAAALGIGEQVIVEAIMKKFGVEREDAEKMKKEYGLTKNPGDGEFLRALTAPLSVMKDEIDKLFVYWHDYSAEQGRESKKIESIILCGSGADFPGLSDYLSANLRVPVSAANVWMNVNSFDEYIPEIPFGDSLKYAAAIGLALRGVYERE